MHTLAHTHLSVSHGDGAAPPLPSEAAWPRTQNHMGKSAAHGLTYPVVAAPCNAPETSSRSGNISTTTSDIDPRTTPPQPRRTSHFALQRLLPGPLGR